MARASRVVIGIGSPYRRDDGLGIVVARLLRQRRLDDCVVRESGGEGAELTSLWGDAKHVILVDAVRARAPAGTVFHIDAVRSKVPVELLHCSTHAFGVAEAIEMARALHALPPRVTVYGVVGATFAAGTGLTAEVAEAGRRVAARIIEELGDGTLSLRESRERTELR